MANCHISILRTQRANKNATWSLLFASQAAMTLALTSASRADADAAVAVAIAVDVDVDVDVGSAEQAHAQLCLGQKIVGPFVGISWFADFRVCGRKNRERETNKKKELSLTKRQTKERNDNLAMPGRDLLTV